MIDAMTLLAGPPAFAGFTPADAGTGPAVRFGVVADPQYAPVPPEGSCHFAATPGKLAAAVATLNAARPDFVVTLGDLVDRSLADYPAVLAPYAALRAPAYFLLGNHDARERLRAGIAPGPSGSDFAAGGWRFLVLDGTEVSLFGHPPDSPAHAEAAARLARLQQAGAVNAWPWNGGLSEAQLAWAEGRLRAARAAGERVIVQCHFPAYPKHSHNLMDDEGVVALLSGHDNVALYMAGHNHFGNYGRAGSCHFVTFHGMVETAATSAFAVVELWEDRIEILGHGREPSRRLAL